MHAKDAVGHHSCDGEEIKGIRYDFPRLEGESSLALIIKAIEFIEF